MASLSREYRRQLERVIIEARREGEKGAVNALKSLAVDHHEPLGGMTVAQRDLRNRLRAHGRQLGDELDKQRGTQGIRHLASECAYEHWHRMLFARFLAENNLLIEPESGMALSLDECRDLAREKNTDWLELASNYAVKMLPQIFRAGDPVLEVALPPEARHCLEELFESLPIEVFAADDSLGWVYQFWQSELKDQVNASGGKIGADELPAVTQLFTEDYMVLFLLHNTLGAWWTSKRKIEGKTSSLSGYEWTYLRLKDDGTPAGGSFESWPKLARDLKVLDPSMGSGHFLTFALHILVGFRMEEEGLSRREAVYAVLRDNLFGLEIDNRCTQIAAFNLALAAWRFTGNVLRLPELNLACSGIGINAKEEDWVELAGRDDRLRETMRALYRLFLQAPVLGSLIDPRRAAGPLFAAEFEQVRPLLMRAIASEQRDETTSELAVAAKGVLAAAHMLADKFTLVVTNVPYLTRGKHCDALREYADRYFTTSRLDLATMFLMRSRHLCGHDGATALVLPHTWLFLQKYKYLRAEILKEDHIPLLSLLGSGAFQTVSGEIVNVVLYIGQSGQKKNILTGLDCSVAKTPSEKAAALLDAPLRSVLQSDLLTVPDQRILVDLPQAGKLLDQYARGLHGQSSFDAPCFILRFWEVDNLGETWELQQTTAESTSLYGGCYTIYRWEKGCGLLADMMQAKEREGYTSGAWRAGVNAWGKRGIAVTGMNNLYYSLYLGRSFDSNVTVILPDDERLVPAIWSYCMSGELDKELRKIDKKFKITYNTVVKVPFEVSKWSAIAEEQGPLPPPHSSDPAQWLFDGHPQKSAGALQVGVARLVGYRWPRQVGSSISGCPPLCPDSLEQFADKNGIVCLMPVKGEASAADRLGALLANAYEAQWSAGKSAELLSQVVSAGNNLGDWLRDSFFDQHCELFHQRPFVLHIWDGLKDGFGALVNYHKLVGPNGDGRRTLEKLIYTYLGDWIDRQRADQKIGAEGSDARLAAAVHLQKELTNILNGEPPYDIFVRWKPLHEQPIGWEPDINDGVRVNIRPLVAAKTLNGRGKSICILRSTPRIKWDKDRGKEPQRPKEDFPWFWSWDGCTENFEGGREFDANRWNDLHYSNKAKREARERHEKKQKGKGAGK